MPFDVVFDFAYDQQRVLLEHSKLQGVGDADLFRNRFLARASRPLEQISSRLCALSALFALFSHQACASILSPMRCCGSLRNYAILFSSTKGAVAILLVSFCPVTRHSLVHQARLADQGRGGVDSKTCSGSWLGTDAGINRLRNSGRARGSRSPSRRKAKRSENSWSESGGNFDKAGSRRRRTGAIGPVLCVRSAASPIELGHIAARVRSHPNDDAALRRDW